MKLSWSNARKYHKRKKAFGFFYETARQRTLMFKISFGKVETWDLYVPCGPSAPIQAQVVQIRHFRPLTSYLLTCNFEKIDQIFSANGKFSPVRLFLKLKITSLICIYFSNYEVIL
jgi:hypothetical protein